MNTEEFNEEMNSVMNYFGRDKFVSEHLSQIFKYFQPLDGSHFQKVCYYVMRDCTFPPKLAEFVSGERKLKEWELAQARVKNSPEAKWDCSWCNQSGFVSAFKEWYEFVYRCQCEFGVRISKDVPIFYYDTAIRKGYKPRLWDVNANTLAPEKVYHRDFTPAEIAENFKKLKKIVRDAKIRTVNI